MRARHTIKLICRHRLFSTSLALAVVLAVMSGCASPVPVTSNPTGATVFMNGARLGLTPTEATLDKKNSVPFEFRLDGYFPETVVVDPNAPPAAISASLEPTTLKKTYDLASNPDGASVSIDGQPVGTTPVSAVPVVYVRDSKSSPWRSKTLVVAKTDYQTETLVLSADANTVPKVELALLKQDRVYTITATNTDGAELNADVTFNGKVVGKTPLKLPVTFQRRDKTTPWPTFPISVEIPAQYSAATAVADFPGGTSFAFKLNAITEITTDLVYPAVEMTPVGATLKTDHRHANAILSTRETSEIISDIKMVTNYPRQDMVDAAASHADSINSFCVTADGQNVIFSLTEHDERGVNYSNLWIKRADSAASSQSRLTTTSAWDTMPYIANDSNNYLVFASNRGDRGKFDVYRATFVDNRISGGFSRLTNDSRFNFSPTYGDSNRQIFYLSTEPNFPKAESVISYMRNDGTLTTQLSTSAQEINNTFADKVFYVKVDPDTKTKQIYSITADGKLETELLNQEDFKKSNCFNPAVSLDGNRVLFVSDHAQDEQGRHNNDIYVVNADGTGLQTLTRNGSDDIMPAWSPSEEGVVFFLSNRGGAYNIWRMKLSAGTK